MMYHNNAVQPWLDDLGTERHSRARAVLAVGRLMLAHKKQGRHASREPRGLGREG